MYATMLPANAPAHLHAAETLAVIDTRHSDTRGAASDG